MTHFYPSNSLPAVNAEGSPFDKLVGRLCLRAELIADDNLHLSLEQWSYLVDTELALLRTPLAA